MRLPGYSLDTLLSGLDPEQDRVMELVVELAHAKAHYDKAEALIKQKETELSANWYDASRVRLMEVIDKIKLYKESVDESSDNR